MPPIDYVFAGPCPEFERMGQPIATHQVAKDCKKCLELWQLPPDPPPAQVAVKDGRQTVVAHKIQRRPLVQVAACWQHLGFAACYGTHHKEYDDTLCRGVFDWLGIDPEKPTSHGTRRPACMAGAVAAYLARHADHRQSVQEWCAAYRRLCGTKGKGAPYTSMSGLYVRISQRDATEGKEKVRVFFNTYMALKAHCNGHPTPAFSDPPESINLLADPTKV